MLAISFALVVGLSPMASDLYLPAIPEMSELFGVGTQIVEVSISAYLFGFGCGQLVAAPVSDRLGRRPVMLFGILAFFLATVAIAFCGSVNQLILLRLAQGVGGGVCAVNVMAGIGDLYDERDAARMYSLVHLFGLTVPLLAPAIGAVLIAYLPWQAEFGFLALYSVITFMFAHFCFSETVVRESRSQSLIGTLQSVWKDYVYVLMHPGSIWFILLTALAFSLFFIYLTDAAFVYLDYFGASTTLFPFLFGANVIAMMACNRINLLLLKRLQPSQLVRVGHVLQLCAVTALLLCSWLLPGSLALFLPLVMVATGANAFIIGNTTARYISLFKARRGTASAVGGVVQFTAGALVSAGIGLVHDGTPLTTSTGMFACAVLAALVSLRISRLRTLTSRSAG